MARGVMPRRPAKSGRHEGVAARQQAAKVLLKKKQSRTESRMANSRIASRARPSKSGNGARRVTKADGYTPIAPERIAEILKRLDQLYPDVTCALTHRDPWELLVATILSAQSTDVRVNMVTPE